jgi:hypothetical protein
LQLWLLEAMLSASAMDEIEAHQFLRLPESFPFSFTVNVGDLRGHEGFNINRQGLDMDMVSVRQVKVEPPPKSPVKAKKSNKQQPKQDQLLCQLDLGSSANLVQIRDRRVKGGEPLREVGKNRRGRTFDV